MALGLLDRQDGRYATTPEADQFLDPAMPSYIGGGLRASQYADWAKLTDALRTGRPQRNESAAGGERWEERYGTPDGVRERTRFFTAVSGLSARGQALRLTVAQSTPLPRRRERGWG